MSTSQPPAEMQKKQPTNTRLSQACIQCRERKRKCNGESPCLPCIKESGKCTYSESRKRGPPRGYLENLESRLGETENALLECLVLLEERGGFPPPDALVPRRLAIEQQNTARQRTKRVSTWEDRPLTDWSAIWGWKRAMMEDSGVLEGPGPEESFGAPVVVQETTTSTSTHGGGQNEMLEIDPPEERGESLQIRTGGDDRGGSVFWGLDGHLGSDLTHVIQNRHHEAHSPSENIAITDSYNPNTLLHPPPVPLESDKYRFEDAAPHSRQAATAGSWEENIEECRVGGQVFAESSPKNSLMVMRGQTLEGNAIQTNETSDNDTLVDRQLFW